MARQKTTKKSKKNNSLSLLGVISRGIRLPIIKAGEENLKQIIIDSLIDAKNEVGQEFRDKDIICITESIVARSENNYVSVNDIANNVKKLFGLSPEIVVAWPIYSRNRFSMILKGIARAASKIYLLLDTNSDEVGNDKLNPFTGINIEEFYEDLIKSENCEFELCKKLFDAADKCSNILLSRCHPKDIEREYIKTVYQTKNKNISLYELKDLCSIPSKKFGYNTEYGLLGSNKATEETLKLFPRYDTCKELCEGIKEYFKESHNVDLEVMVYGDGCFKDPIGHIWEWADPVVSPYYTKGLEGAHNEIKIKYVADNESSDIEFVKEKIKSKNKNLKGKMISQGTTPRRYCDLVGSLADLTSGSGDKGTPVIWISNYFNNYAD